MDVNKININQSELTYNIVSVDSYESNDASNIENANTHVMTHSGNAIKPMTDFNSVFDSNGESLNDAIGTLGSNISELEYKTRKIGNEVIDTDEDDITIQDINGNTVFHLNENGLDAKNVRSNGKDVLTEHQDISEKADKSYVDAKFRNIEDVYTSDSDESICLTTDYGNEVTSISVSTRGDNDEEQIFCSDDENEIYVKIGTYGIKVKAIKNLDGTNIINDSCFKNKRILFFGDSLVAASTPQNTNRGFVKLIADRNGCAYKSYYYTINPSEQDKQDVCFKNIARDGLSLCQRDEISYGSIYDRVMNWCVPGLCDLVVLQGGYNDPSPGTDGRGTISENDYVTATDTHTTLGAFEAMIKHCTNNGIKICYIVTHHAGAYASDSLYDDIFNVCRKWGVPYLNLTRTAGFYISSNNVAHGERYSIYTSEEWTSTKTYILDDKVRYQGKSYKCIVDSVTGVVPTNVTKWVRTSDLVNDFCHLNNLGHEIISYKIEEFIKSI